MREKIQKGLGETSDNTVDCVPVKTEDCLYMDRRNTGGGKGNTFRVGKKTQF